jgi:hypothetical protein
VLLGADLWCKAWAGFSQQRRDAKKRSIPFEFEFSDWLMFWVRSGHLAQRGARKGQYVMARYQDKGPYTRFNTQIILCEQNHKDAAPRMRGIPKSEESKAKMRAFRLGTKLTEEHKRKIGNSQRGIPKGPMKEETKRKLSLARKGVRTGRTISAENMRKMLLKRYSDHLQ